MKYLRLLLFPFSLLYGLVVIVRNWFYDTGLLKSRRFDIPVISIGNLEVGGSGKSPMTEYLIRLFKNNYKVAALSHGYGRETTGFIRVNATDTATRVGDEPAQFKHKFPDVTVVVCEKRVNGITQLQPDHNLIIMDDAYQHRAVKPGLSILLFDYNNYGKPSLLLPAGNMREPFSGRWRADIIIISKCPEMLADTEQAKFTATIAPLPYQHLFFTAVTYQCLQNRHGKAVNDNIEADTTVFLLTGIAKPGPLVEHIKKHTLHIIHHNYADHHRFTLKNITKLADEFLASTSQKKLIITTEKDAQRLGEHDLLSLVDQLPFLVIPIGIKFLNGQQQEFDQLVNNYVREYTEHH